jgi:PKD repeat protein
MVRGIVRAAVGFVGMVMLWFALAVPSAAAAPVEGPIAGIDRPHPVVPAQRQSRATGLDPSQNLIDYGGPVVHSSSVTLIFWNPSNDNLSWDLGYRELMTRFVQDVATDAGKTTNPYSLTPQYANGTGPVPYNRSSARVIDDTDPGPTLPPPALQHCTPPAGWSICLNSSDLANELKSFITAQNALHPGSFPTGMNQIYMLVTPYGLGSCNNAGTSCLFTDYCAYHSVFENGAGSLGDPNTVLWANIPYTAGHCRATWPRPNGNPADTVISSISHEDLEILTDPLPVSTLKAWQDASGNEIGDLCAGAQGYYLNGSSGSSAYDTLINSHPYNIQAEWSNSDNGSCQMDEQLPAASFTTSPAGRVAPGQTVGFDGSASTSPDSSVVLHSWDFGDGTTAPSGLTASHAYAADGTYTVTMTAYNQYGRHTSVTQQVVVDEQPTAKFTATTAHPLPRSPVAFNSTGTGDSDGSISSYAWSFGDGGTGSGGSPSHAYSRPGTYTVTLIATDSSGQTAAASQSVLVNVLARVANVRVTKQAGRRVLLLSVSGSGTLIVNGHRFRARSAGRLRVKLPLTGRQARQLRQRHTVKLMLKFVPSFGPPQKITVKLR